MVRVFVAFVGIFIINMKAIACQMKCEHLKRERTGKSRFNAYSNQFLCFGLCVFALRLKHPQSQHQPFPPFYVTCDFEQRSFDKFPFEQRRKNGKTMSKRETCDKEREIQWHDTRRFNHKKVKRYVVSGINLSAFSKPSKYTLNHFISNLINAFGRA